MANSFPGQDLPNSTPTPPRPPGIPKNHPKLPRTTHTLAQASLLANNLGYRVVVEAPKNNGGGYIYLKGWGLTALAAINAITPSEVKRSRPGWGQKTAWVI